ncbi:1,4-dihydroxy-2-naphthoate polyprenyltransferase [Lacticaseibacillus saniviri]|uniref:1,4-dihydroxy-2-naphthoate polyprenyltransferase n=1 Tax=Lacticaseibacillus saniviri JCM 17471 = DSM 24301 TaxID=1293598 RepID=A0A0R2MTJ5_9LACO|nr:1,4-dihydroxy-2-naphthoate polyprenyltransferase [Lacticaseibacillus saniviri]KRO16936.1 1,4-dihydroxy-2-naphthoate polyprenyltransferase [Lacticaseibacillus saniviri JCM 17471 = DSM 24301]MCG4281602.1 1,4-dihydroxy-2-naphthoate polyprenyltransferase [Lacticaseibacillus saniviri]
MSVKVFLELVEIKAKTASIFPFLMGSLYAWYHFHHLHLTELIVFFIAMLLFNMAVDANDNYQDYRRSQRTNADDFRKRTNVIGVNHINPNLVLALIIGMTVVSGGLGLWMVSQAGWPLLVMGVFSFAVGYLYAGGPRPISSTPFGEFFSGFTMGFIIWLIAVYVNTFDTVAFNWALIWPIWIASGLAQFAIAALLLANNIADEEEDLTLHRHTIVSYLGRQKSIAMFIEFYNAGYVLLILASLLGILPKLALLTVLTYPLVMKQARAFGANPVKSETFIFAIKNLLITTLAQVVFMAVGVGLNI